MEWDGIPWPKWPGETIHGVTTSAVHATLVRIWEHILRCLCCQEKKNITLHSPAFPWGHPECDLLLKLNSMFDLLNERKRNPCQPKQFFRWASILSTRIILEISHGTHPIRGESLQALWSFSHGMCSVWFAEIYPKHSQLRAPHTPCTSVHTLTRSFQLPAVFKITEFYHNVFPLLDLV